MVGRRQPRRGVRARWAFSAFPGGHDARGINVILQDELGYAINVALRECYMGGARSMPLPRRHQTGCSEPQQPAGCARAAKTRVEKVLDWGVHEGDTGITWSPPGLPNGPRRGYFPRRQYQPCA